MDRKLVKHIGTRQNPKKIERHEREEEWGTFRSKEGQVARVVLCERSLTDNGSDSVNFPL